MTEKAESLELTDEEHRVFVFLDALRESGVTNMFGAGQFIQDSFGFDKTKSRGLLTKWMKTFGVRHPK